MQPSLRCTRGQFLSALAVLFFFQPNAATAEDRSGQSEHKFVIKTLSGQADRVSGDDALVEITFLPRERRVTVTLNGRDITSEFRPGQTPNSLVGLVEGLVLGRNRLRAEGRHGSASRTLTNYSIEGPIISGPWIQPFICQTNTFMLPDGTTLGPPIDDDCSAETRVNYVYMSTIDGMFRPLLDPTMLPPDVAQTTTSEGVTVPYVVRVETGTIDRAIYQTAVLFDPAADKALTPFDPPQSWNRRLVYTFGGGCVGGWYIQGNSVGNRGILEDLMLRQGYALASSSLNVFGKRICRRH